MKSKVKFSTGFNAGSRHAGLSITPPDFTFHDKSGDFKAGYRFGIFARRTGLCIDPTTAAGALHTAWLAYESGAAAPKVTL